MESLWLHRHHPSWSPLSSSAVSMVVVDDGNLPNVNTSLLYESRNCLNCDFTYVVITNHIPLSTYANLWQTTTVRLKETWKIEWTSHHDSSSVSFDTTSRMYKIPKKNKNFQCSFKKLTWNSVFGYSKKCFIPKNSCTSLKNCNHAKRMPGDDAQWN